MDGTISKAACLVTLYLLLDEILIAILELYLHLFYAKQDVWGDVAGRSHPSPLRRSQEYVSTPLAMPDLR